MAPPSMESIFLILSGVILAAGVLYWFWSHIQLTQKKVQLLESAVFELRGLLTPAPQPSDPTGPTGPAGPAGPTGPEAETEEDWAPASAEEFKSTPLESLESLEKTVDLQPRSGGGKEGMDLQPRSLDLDLEDLQPGGGAKVGEPEGQDGFRELFIQHDPPMVSANPANPASPAPKPEATPESLDAMPVRELRRLAEQRGLTNVSDMRKKELLAALRQQIGAPVIVERIVDLEETDA